MWKSEVLKLQFNLNHKCIIVSYEVENRKIPNPKFISRSVIELEKLRQFFLCLFSFSSSSLSPSIVFIRINSYYLPPYSSSHCWRNLQSALCLRAAMKGFQINNTTLTLALFTDVTNSKYSLSLPVFESPNFINWN